MFYSLLLLPCKEIDQENLLFLLFYFILFFWPCHVVCGILVPRPGIEPGPPALEAWSFNHWTAREVPKKTF